MAASRIRGRHGLKRSQFGLPGFPPPGSIGKQEFDINFIPEWDEYMAMVREKVKELEPTKIEKIFKRVSKWGLNASPFKVVKLQLKLHWTGISYWMDVRKTVKSARGLIDHIDGLERGARVLRKASNELWNTELELPLYPLETEEKVARMVVTTKELEEVNRYGFAAATIANDAMSVRAELQKAIAGWDAVLEQARAINDFTRGAVWDSITDLNLRFNTEGGSFHAYLTEARDTAVRVEDSARYKQYHAAHILNEWTPAWYKPPTPIKKEWGLELF